MIGGSHKRARHPWETALFKSYFKMKMLFLCEEKGEHVQGQQPRSQDTPRLERMFDCVILLFLNTKPLAGSPSAFLG